jgi:hypothetical protein
LALVSLGIGSCLGAPTDAKRVISLSYDFAQPQVELEAGEARVTVAGCEILNRPGEPSLPFQTARILLPPGFTVEAAAAQVEESGRMPYRWCYYEITLLGDPPLSIAMTPSSSN